MNPLEAAALVALLALPLHFAVQWHLARLEDPLYLRAQGIVVVRESALSAHGEAIGEYQGHPIWETVTFKRMHYRFSRVTQREYREKLAGGELYLDPGLVYVAT